MFAGNALYNVLAKMRLFQKVCVPECATNRAEFAEKLILYKYFRNGEQLKWKHTAFQ